MYGMMQRRARDDTEGDGPWSEKGRSENHAKASWQLRTDDAGSKNAGALPRDFNDSRRPRGPSVTVQICAIHPNGNNGTAVVQKKSTKVSDWAQCRLSAAPR